MDYMLEGMEEEAREGMRRDFDGVLNWVHSVKRGEGNGLYDVMETNKNKDIMETKFKVGDRVSIKGTYDGKFKEDMCLIWGVRAIRDNRYVLECEEGKIIGFLGEIIDFDFADEDRLELVEGRKEVGKFKVGDRVRLKKPLECKLKMIEDPIEREKVVRKYEENKDKVFIVERVTVSDDGQEKISFIILCCQGMADKVYSDGGDIELVEGRKEVGKFKVGDRVRIDMSNKEAELRFDEVTKRIVFEVIEGRNERGNLKIRVVEDEWTKVVLGNADRVYWVCEDMLLRVEKGKEYREGEECVAGEKKKGGFELYRDYARERVGFGYFEKGYECKATSGLEFLVRKADNKNLRECLRGANEFVVMSVSYDGEGLDCVLTPDEAEQLALVLRQKVREVREDRTMEVNKGR